MSPIGRSPLALIAVAWSLVGAAAVSADPLPYRSAAPLPAPVGSPAMASGAPFTPLVKSLLHQLEPAQPDPATDVSVASGTTMQQLTNADLLLHGTEATAPPETGCTGVGANNAPTGTSPAIAPLCWTDAMGVGPTSGDQVHRTTAEPMRMGLGSSWDPAVMNDWGQVEGAEARQLGITGIYAPQVDVVRIPNWGRDLSTLGEDPFLNGELGAGEVNGIQGKGAMAQPKHFAFYEGQIFKSDTQVQDQAAHAIYLTPYEYATSDSGQLSGAGRAASMMCSYQDYEIVAAPGVTSAPADALGPTGGELACQNDLKNRIVRDQWHWQGFFASDYRLGLDNGPQAIDSGMDQEMPDAAFLGPTLVAEVMNGQVSLHTFNTALARIIYQEERFHLLGHPDADSNYLSPSNPTDTAGKHGVTRAQKAAHAHITERAAEESAVLLKDVQQTLPLTAQDLKKGVLVVGSGAEYMPAMPVAEASPGFADRDAISPLEQLRQFAPSGAKITYLPWNADSAPTPADGEAVSPQDLSTDGAKSGTGLLRTAGPGAPTTDRQIDFTSVSGHGQLKPAQTYTWDGYLNVPTADDYTLRFQFSIPDVGFTAGALVSVPTIPGEPPISAGGGLVGSSSDPCTSSLAPSFSIAQSPGQGQSMQNESLSDSGTNETGVATSLTMSGYTERGLANCLYHAGNLSAGMHQIKISLTTPSSLGTDSYNLREPGVTQPSFRFAYSRTATDAAKAIVAAKHAAKVIVFAGVANSLADAVTPSSPLKPIDAGDAAMIDALAKANPNTAVILNTDTVVEAPWLSEVKAVLETWYPGSEGGTATAQLILGQVNPSGHLTETWPASSNDTVYTYNETKPLYPGDTTGVHSDRLNGAPTTNFSEGIFVGYRFFDKEGIAPQFPFGYGLSYTPFRYSRLSITQAGGGLNVGFDVTNKGKVAGASVPQVYVGPAPSVPAGVQQAVRSLAGFDRVTLKPRQTKHLTIHIGTGKNIDGHGNQRAFQYWDTAKQAWVTASGARRVWVGSADAGADLPLTRLGLIPAKPKQAGCPAATGSLTATKLGLLRLGMTRGRARRLLRRYSTRGRRHMDFYCLRNIGIRAGYGYATLVRTLPRAQRRRLNGRIVLLLTANRRYRLHGIHPGMRAKAAARQARLSSPFKVGQNTWYLTTNGPSRGILKVRHGLVEEIGIADNNLTQTRRLTQRLLNAFA